MTVGKTAYNLIFKRNSTYVAFIIGGAVLGEAAVHKVFDQIWENNNKGVRTIDFLSFCLEYFADFTHSTFSNPQKLFQHQEWAKPKE